MDALRAKKAFICDMDGVIKFLDRIKKERKAFLFLTNSSERSPRELHEKMLRLGMQIDEVNFYTSAVPHGSSSRYNSMSS